jgi:filamentous hemagglutinin family protein
MKTQKKTQQCGNKLSFPRSQLCNAVNRACLTSSLLAAAFLTQGSAFANLPVEAATDSRLNIQSISSNGNSTTVTQNEQVAWVKWDTFNIGTDNTVAFNYTEGGNAFHALNFVLGSDVSNIQGSITSDGNVYLFNSNGIVFSNSAVVDVAGFVASTQAPSLADINAITTQINANTGAVELDLALSDLQSAGLIELSDNSVITSNVNDITLIGRTVQTQNVALSSQGSINVFSSQRSTITLDTDNDVFSVEVTEKLVSDPGSSLVELRDSELVAQVGVNISAHSAQNLTMNAVNTTGIVRANSVFVDADGSVVLGDVDTNNLAVRLSSGSVSDVGIIEAESASFLLEDVTNATINLDSDKNNIGVFRAAGNNLSDINLVDNFGIVLDGINASRMTLSTTGDVTQTEVINVNELFVQAAQGDLRFNVFLDQTFNNGLVFNQIDRFGAIGRDVFLLEANGIELAGVSASNDFALSTDGLIFQTASLGVLNNAFIFARDDAGTVFDIALLDGNNELGTVSAIGDTVSLVDSNELLLGRIDAFSGLNATAIAGDIKGEEQIRTPFAFFNALDNSSADVVLSDINNDFGTVTFNGDHVNEVFINDNFGIVLGGLTADIFTLNTTGTVTQTGLLTIDDAVINAVNGTVTYDIRLDLVGDNGESFNNINVLSGVGNTIALLDSNGIVINGLAASQDLLISTDGDIRQTGTISVGGNSFFAAMSENGVGFDVVLEDVRNDLGVLSSRGSNVSVVDGFGLELDMIEVLNNFNATTTTGDITDNTAIVASNANFNALAGNVLLDSTLNNFGQFSASADRVNVIVNNDLSLGDIAATQVLNITLLNGNVISAGSIETAATNLMIAEGLQSTINLDSRNNQLGVFSATGSYLANISLFDRDGIELGNVQANFLDIETMGDLQQSIQSRIDVNSLSVTLQNGGVVTLGNLENSADTVNIESLGSTTINALNFNGRNATNPSITLNSQDDLSIGSVEAENANIRFTSTGRISQVSEGALMAHSLALVAGDTIELSNISINSDVELISFGNQGSVTVNGIPVVITVDNPIEVTGTVNYATPVNTGALLQTGRDNVQVFTVNGDYFASASLGVITGSTLSNSLVPVPFGGTLEENELAIQLNTQAQNSINLPPVKEVRPFLPKDELKFDDTVVTLPNEQQLRSAVTSGR